MKRQIDNDALRHIFTFKIFKKYSRLKIYALLVMENVILHWVHYAVPKSKVFQ